MFSYGRSLANLQGQTRRISLQWCCFVIERSAAASTTPRSRDFVSRLSALAQGRLTRAADSAVARWDSAQNQSHHFFALDSQRGFVQNGITSQPALQQVPAKSMFACIL